MLIVKQRIISLSLTPLFSVSNGILTMKFLSCATATNRILTVKSPSNAALTQHKSEAGRACHPNRATGSEYVNNSVSSRKQGLPPFMTLPRSSSSSNEKCWIEENAYLFIAAEGVEWGEKSSISNRHDHLIGRSTMPCINFWTHETTLPHMW